MSNMYKIFWSIITVVLINVITANAQQKEQFRFDHKAIYEVVYLSDTLDQGSHKQRITELLIGDEISLYRSSQKAYEDSLYMSYMNATDISMNPPQITSMGEINAFNYQILKDFSSGQTKVYDEYTGSNLNNLKEIAYYFEAQDIMSKWTLKDDTSRINGYLCQRADIDFGERKWIAWFSPELSTYADGPYKFSGLPGLIFRIHDEKKTWDFKLVELSQIDTLIEINFKNGLKFTETTKQQLFKDRRHYQKNQIGIKEAAGTNFGNNRASIQNHLEEYIRQDNNWIELYP